MTFTDANQNPNLGVDESANPDAALDIYQEERPWGNFRQFTKNAPSTVKIITVNPGESLSLQSHMHRAEFWRILKGECKVEIGNKSHDAVVGDEFLVPAATTHRVSVDSSETSPAEFLEIATGEFDENDIERFEDKYGRA
jgi:mannose-6-phosphate isomerase